MTPDVRPARGEQSPRLLLGDCLDQMRTLADNSVDAIVTDPPYGLAFMGANWDYGVPGEMFWREALCVAKPGAHLLAFGGTRTYHRLACAIEDAGWEVRDCIMWVYGSGFPKSMDVAKAIDKMRGNSQRFQRMYAEAVRESGLNHADIDRRLGIKSSSCYWVREDDRKSFPTKENWENLKTFLPLPDNADEIYEEAARKDREVSDMGANKVFQPSQTVINPGTPATPEAATWNGWGTALKPACEPIVVARKPLEGTVAANVLKYGTGAINIDGCRVPTDPHDSSRDGESTNGKDYTGAGVLGWQSKPGPRGGDLRGRFPANLIHDGSDEVLALLPDSKGQCGAVKGTEPSRTGSNGIYGNYNGQNTMSPRGDTGSAARFFYCAKASRSERNKNCERLLQWEQDQELTQLIEKSSQLLMAISESMMQTLDALVCNMTSFGNDTTVQFQSECKSTISMALKLITELKTSLSSQPSNTSDAILDAIKTSEESGINVAQLAEKLNLLKLDSTNGQTDIAINAVNALFDVLSEIRGRAKQGNHHCTIKPLALMRWLITLVTPPGGTVLDPFMGSGTTGVAARQLDRPFVGIERDPHYYDIASRRIAEAKQLPPTTTQQELPLCE